MMRRETTLRVCSRAPRCRCMDAYDSDMLDRSRKRLQIHLNLHVGTYAKTLPLDMKQIIGKNVPMWSIGIWMSSKPEEGKK